MENLSLLIFTKYSFATSGQGEDPGQGQNAGNVPVQI